MDETAADRAADILMARMKPVLIEAALDHSRAEPVIVAAIFVNFDVQTVTGDGRTAVLTGSQFRELSKAETGAGREAADFTLAKLASVDPAKEFLALIIINSQPMKGEIIRLD